jgi:hypothetical protein
MLRAYEDCLMQKLRGDEEEEVEQVIAYHSKRT